MDKTTIKDYYEKNAGGYNHEFFENTNDYPTLLYRQKHMLFLIESLALDSTRTHIADIGCGTGDMTNALAKKGFRVSASDIATNMVEIALKKNTEFINSGQVDIIPADAESLPYNDKTFDLVILSGVIEYLADDEKWMNEAKRVLKPGGYLLLNITNAGSIRRMTQQPFEKLKSFSIFRKAAHYIKHKILHNEPLHYFNFKIRTHRPKLFDQFLAYQGFEKKGQAYFDFCLLPYPLDVLVPVSYKKKLENTAYKSRQLRGCGYIVMAKKMRDRHHH